VARDALELFDSRELTWRLFLRDFSARFRQSFLGYVWAVAPVLITVATFTWLNRTQVLPISKTALPYPLYVLVTMTVWQLFAVGLTNCTQSLVAAGSLITKINFPRETLVIAAFGQALFESAIRVLLVAGGFVIFRVEPAWTFVFVPLAIMPLALLTLGLGFILALLNGVVRDAGQAIGFILMFWMFLTPVVYPAPEGSTQTWSVLNPVTPFINAALDLTCSGALRNPGPYLLASGFAFAVFMLGWRVFHLTEPRIAERI
jgi:lipopolysaccharide transport system permease protein